MMTGGWRRDGFERGLIVRVKASDNNRLGNTWFKGRLLDDDLLLCLHHSGDCFWTFQLLNYCKSCANKGVSIEGLSIVLAPNVTFGSYTLGEKVKVLSEKDMAHLILGHTITL